jgi:hypothetical protein
MLDLPLIGILWLVNSPIYMTGAFQHNLVQQKPSNPVDPFDQHLVTSIRIFILSFRPFPSFSSSGGYSSSYPSFLYLQRPLCYLERPLCEPLSELFPLISGESPRFPAQDIPSPSLPQTHHSFSSPSQNFPPPFETPLPHSPALVRIPLTLFQVRRR